MRAIVSVLTAKLDLPVPSGLVPFGHVPKVRPYRRAGYGSAGQAAGYCYSKGAEAVCAIVLATNIPRRALQTSFQDAHQNPFRRRTATIGRSPLLAAS